MPTPPPAPPRAARRPRPRAWPGAALGALFALALGAAPAWGAAAATPAHASPLDRAALAASIDALLADPALRTARVGVCVADLETGEVLYARGADTLLNPASNVKLFTAAAALDRLGPGYQFVTEVLTDAAPSRGEVGVLYVRGRGDPSMVTERLWALAGDIAHHGVRTVRGDLVVDDAFFDAAREGPGWDQEEGDRPYLAPAGALSLNFNSVGVQIGPGERAGLPARVALEPESEHLVLVSHVRTVGPSAPAGLRVRSERLPDGRQRITAEGAVRSGAPDAVLYRRIEDPPVYFGASLRRLLALRGVTVGGRVRHGAVPETASPLTTSESDGLGAVVRALEKHSNNFMAEQLVKTLGAEASGPPGTWEKGVAAVEATLAGWGLPPGSYVLRNGSGLNDTNRFTPRQIVLVLREAWRRFGLMPEYVASLPVGGRDGTVRRRLEGTDGRVRAKTGTLEGASALSGYVETARGERLAFAAVANGFGGRVRPVARALDAVAAALAAWGGPPPPALAPAVADEPGDAEPVPPADAP